MVAFVEMEHWPDMFPYILFPINFCNESRANDFAVAVYLR